MSRAWRFGAILLLAGCTQATAPVKPLLDGEPPKPDGMFKMVESPEVATYFAAKSVGLYQGNPHLRQFYLINNYSAAARKDVGEPSIYSSRALMVINCERDESARFGRTYFSKPYAEGVEIASKDETPQWKEFPRQSITGHLRDLTCALDPSRLR
ncbi:MULTISPECIES: surface-adhesin E family protein [unclassified Pseudomonas]|uniref:surface-adhesin E family protein n=1 Tax=unclassified Pseudomonas TaxID=196821 RepID=UPI0035C0C712